MKTAVAFGTFDGLHMGHRAVLEATNGFKRVAVTFYKPPKFSLEDGGQLMTYEDRKECLKELGIEQIECLYYEDVKDMSPQDFLKFISQKFDVGLISCGYNFRFGKGASGDTETLKKYCEENSIKLVCCNAVKSGERVISSSLIRDYIKNGDLKAANELMYRPFSFTDTVRKGDMRGRTIGFPTANQLIPKELVVPKLGVYESEVLIGGKMYKSVSNIGYRPTYKTNNITCETHIIDFSEDIYSQNVTVFPKRFIREEIKFSNIKELERAIKKDIAEVVK